ncbi:MAG: FHA domain-containing protein [Burkholderiaceae bacterium]|nr:FHA domain-containing protein [Burkholderiaceae bacterium]
MAKLILSFDGAMIKTVELNKERTTIGRRPENDIQVDNLAVSGQHAVVTTILNDSVIEDLHSTNGTMVNGKLIQKHLLQQGDTIEIGKHMIKYVVEAAAAKPYQDFAKTMVIRKPDAGAMAAAAAAAPAVAAAEPAPVRAAPPAPAQPAAVREAGLQILTGSNAGRVLELNKSLTTLGKAGHQVAVFTRRPVGFFVTHVEGDNFPLVNGEAIGTQARQLNDQDTIEIAGTKMSFFYKN